MDNPAKTPTGTANRKAETTKERSERRRCQEEMLREAFPGIETDELRRAGGLGERRFWKYVNGRRQGAYAAMRIPEVTAWQLETIKNLNEKEFAIWKAFVEHGDTELCRSCLQDRIGHEHSLGTNGSTPLKNLRQKGFLISDGRPGTGCDVHTEGSTWQRLLTPLPERKFSTSRAKYTPREEEEILRVLGNRDAFTGVHGKLEVDHRVPVMRLGGVEEKVDTTDAAAVRERYQLLTREHNAQKRELCNQCVRYGKRPAYQGIPFWYEGCEEYDEAVGCNGCGLAYPERWRAAVAVALSPRER